MIGAAQCSVGGVAVQVPPARPLANPEERSIAEPQRRAVDVDPRVRRLPEEALDLARVRFRPVQIEPGLLPILHLEDDVPAVGRPSDVHDERRSLGV